MVEFLANTSFELEIGGPRQKNFSLGMCLTLESFGFKVGLSFNGQKIVQDGDFVTKV